MSAYMFLTTVAVIPPHTNLVCTEFVLRLALPLLIASSVPLFVYGAMLHHAVHVRT